MNKKSGCRKPLLQLVALLLLGTHLAVIEVTCDQQQQREAGCDSNEVCPAPSNGQPSPTDRHPNYYTEASNSEDKQQQLNDSCHFRAAVVEYNRIDLDDCDTSAALNLNYLEEATKLAAQNGSQLIVFPEDAIAWGPIEYLQSCLEEIPDPHNITEASGLVRVKDGGNPCMQPELFGAFKILTKLSCMARQHNIYIVANYGTREHCNQKLDKTCPKSGFKPLNTNVILDPTGKYIGRYRKYNPFIEVFDKAPQLEHVYFDTPFGRFGVFTCFDMIFKHPAVDLVEKYHIDTAIFPTWWYDELPILTALQFQDAWSTRHQVNLLASNILKPSLGSTGSSIFSGNQSVYVGAPNKQPKLLIANLLKRRNATENETTSQCPPVEFNPVIMDLPSPMINETYEHKNYALYFNTDDVFLPVGHETGGLVLCARRTCCKLKMVPEMDSQYKESTTELVLIVRHSRRSGKFEWSERVCALATLNHKLVDVHKPLIFSQQPAPIRFKSLSLSAMFDTDYVYPHGAHNVSHLLDRTDREYSCEPKLGRRHCELTLTKDGLRNHPNGTYLYSFGLYGRVYEEDK